jgi:hypothetical protein
VLSARAPRNSTAVAKSYRAATLRPIAMVSEGRLCAADVVAPQAYSATASKTRDAEDGIKASRRPCHRQNR